MTATRKFVLLLLASLAAAPAAHAQAGRLVVLVRHAEAGGEPQRDPPLTARGQERARALAQALEHTAIGTVIVSGLQRTRLTAAPFAVAQGLEPIVVETSDGIEAHVAGVVAAVRAAPVGQAVLVVGHSNTVPRIIQGLGGPDLEDLCHAEFSGVFVLALENGARARLVHAHYGAPDDLEECG